MSTIEIEVELPKPTDRFERQSAIVPMDRLSLVKPTVIGVGAVGRQVALLLAQIGVKHLTLFDFDKVEETNITTQGYRADEVGMPKVNAMANEILRIDESIELHINNDRFRPKHGVGDVVFVCVDSISTRSAIWEALQHRVQLWIDARVLGETMRILTSQPRIDSTYYASTLFAQSEAQTGACTSRMTSFSAMIAASMMIHQFTRWLRGVEMDRDILFSLLGSELVIS